MTALLEVADLEVHFRMPYGIAEMASGAARRKVQAVNSVNLALRRGETLGLVGESGCGKTTLGRAILRLVNSTAGSVAFDGTDVLALDREALFAFRRRAQMVFQDPHAALNPKLSVGQTLSEVLRVHEICPAGEVPDRVARLMETAGLSPDLADLADGR